MINDDERIVEYNEEFEELYNDLKNMLNKDIACLPCEVLFEPVDLEDGWFKIFKHIVVRKQGLELLIKLLNFKNDC